jgi:hypothetical protein
MLNFGKANAKLIRLQRLVGGKIATFSLLSGVTCPYSKECESKAVENPGGSLHIEDGKNTLFRCFSASQEVLFTNVYNSRKANTENVANLLGQGKFVQQFLTDLPKKTTILRWHVAGDAKTQAYFDAMIEIAKARPNIVFYAYTKSLPFWVKRINDIPKNLILTASKGGHKDSLIDKYNLRYALVVPTQNEADKLGLPVDHDDYHAYNPETKNQSFALLIHGIQPAGSKWGKAVRALKGEGSYKR